MSQAQTSNAAAAAPSKDESSASLLYKEREARRQILQATNLDVWATGPRPAPSQLDSNLKKNTAFVKRVKLSLAQESKDQLLKDLPLLNLEKYIQELVQAVSDGLTKCTAPKDCFAAGEILTAFHSRFGGEALSVPLTQSLAAALASPSKTAYQDVPAEQKEREETARLARQRPLLRVTAELALIELVGHHKDTSGQEWLYQLLKSLLATDREHSNVMLLTSLLKGLAPSIMPANTTEQTKSLSLEGATTLVSQDMKLKFYKLFEAYLQTMTRRVVKEHKQIQDQEKRNHETAIRTGQIFEDRQQNYERMTSSYEKIRDSAKVLSDLLSIPMPALDSAAKANNLALGVNLDSKSAFERRDEEFASASSPWEDDDSRKFYQDLLDLADIIPPSILANIGAVVPKEADEPKDADKDQDKAPAVESQTAAPVEHDATEDSMSAGPAAILSTLFAKLPDMTNRTMIDSAAVDFTFIASKQARKKLVTHLASVPRNRTDVLPYYARLAATLSKYMPDIGSSLVALLEDEFRYFQKKRHHDVGEARTKNARYLAELTKFQVTPMHVIFHCLTVCLDDFSGPSVDVLAALLETCGRYLLRTEETSARTRAMLELLRRKRAAVNLDHRQLLMLDNAYYHCNPPERRAIEYKQRTPMQAYLRHLMYNTLSKKTIDYVVGQFRKLHWEDAEVYASLVELCSRCWKVRFSNIYLLAILLYDLDQHHPRFVIDVIDQLLENIRLGMEQNIFQHNQRRVATICYLGELYNYRLINSSLVFEQLWSLTTFAHPGGRPLPGQVVSLDAPDDYFRIRLVCSLLDTCGLCFDSGSLKKRLDEFLIFFNLYTLTKEQPLPMDVEFMLTATLETLRPALVWKKHFAEAAQAFDELTAAQRLAAGHSANADADDIDDEDDDDDASERSGRQPRTRQMRSANAAGSDSDGGELGTSVGVSNGNSDNEAEEEAIFRRREEEQANRQQTQDEFDRELAKMMAESSTSGPSHSATTATQTATPALARSSIFVRGGTSGNPLAYGAGRTAAGISAGSKRSEIGLPIRRGAVVTDAAAVNDDNHMNFALLSKKGSKQVTQNILVPSNTSIAINTRNMQLKEEEERKRLKQLVLAYERSAENDQTAEVKNMEQQLRSLGIRVRSSPHQ